MGTITLQAAFVVDPGLQNNSLFLAAVVIAVTWLAALLALRGLRVAKALTWYAVIAGVVVPTLIVVGLAIAWLIDGRPVQMATNPGALIPHLGTGDVAFLSGALLMFMGIEISAIHAGDVRDPGRTIPRANAVAVALCFLLFVPLTLALAIVIPGKDINIITGLMQAADRFLDDYGAHWLVPVFAAMLVTGLAAALVQILGGPSAGCSSPAARAATSRRCCSGRTPRRCRSRSSCCRRRSARCSRSATHCSGLCRTHGSCSR